MTKEEKLEAGVERLEERSQKPGSLNPPDL
jgi:hypothetical protein